MRLCRFQIWTICYGSQRLGLWFSDLFQIQFLVIRDLIVHFQYSTVGRFSWTMLDLYGRQTGGEVQIGNQHMHEVVSAFPECLVLAVQLAVKQHYATQYSGSEI